MSARARWLFAVVAVLWGLPYLFIRIAVEAGIDPVVVVWTRTGVAVLVLVPLALWRGALRGIAGRWRLVLGLTVLQVTAPFLLITYGEQRITSSLAGLLVAAEPLFVALLIRVIEPAARIGRVRTTGLVVGLAGVAVLLGLDVSALGPQLLGGAMVLLATLLYAGAALLVRRIPANTDPIGVITAVLLVNTVLLAPVAVPALPDPLPAPEVVGSLVGLALACTAAAFVAYFALIAETGPGPATVVFYVAPVITVATGVVLLGEPLTVAIVLGVVLIVVGSLLATGGRAETPGRTGQATKPT